MNLPYILFFSIFVLSKAGYEVIADASHPTQRVVKLIQDLKSKVMAEGSAEQISYDEYACWCEKTLERKASDISSAKELIEETEILIKKLEGELSSHGAEIAQLNKDIASNRAAQKDAETVRSNDHHDYAEERSESEQCIGAMEAAIGTLTGAGTKKGFLDTSSHAAQLLSVAARVRTVFQAKSMPHSVSEQDIDVLKNFVAEPVDFLKAPRHAATQQELELENEDEADLTDSERRQRSKHRSAVLSATQLGQNPFGDYAPQSTQIQGILKGMYDAFTADLEKDNAAESESQKSFQELMATKKEEQATLEDTLEKQEADQAAKTKTLRANEIIKDDTASQLEADEAFFADTKSACQAKAKEWSNRIRLRTEELSGMSQAIQILSSEDAKSKFKSSAETQKKNSRLQLLQLVSIKEHHAIQKDTSKTYSKLQKLATQYQSLGLAKIAAAVRMGGHFDKVMSMIDDMVALLREEEADDIAHRDLCENSINGNNNEIADLEHSIKKTKDMIKRLNNTKNGVDAEIQATKIEIKSTQKSQAELLEFRNKDVAEFSKSVKNDVDALPIIKEAIAALSKFYKNNKIPLELAQKSPEYDDHTTNADKAPEPAWSGSEYGAKKSETTGIVGILEMLVDDVEKEIADARADDADAKAQYDKQNGALQNTLDAQEETKVTLEEESAATKEKMDAAETFKDGEEKNNKATNAAKKALGTDCAWVQSHFKSRREKRKDEIQSLVDAKAFLAAVESGDDPLSPL